VALENSDRATSAIADRGQDRDASGGLQPKTAPNRV
jgi:hypothetical protein